MKLIIILLFCSVLFTACIKDDPSTTNLNPTQNPLPPCDVKEIPFTMQLNNNSKTLILDSVVKISNKYFIYFYCPNDKERIIMTMRRYDNSPIVSTYSQAYEDSSSRNVAGFVQDLDIRFYHPDNMTKTKYLYQWADICINVDNNQLSFSIDAIKLVESTLFDVNYSTIGILKAPLISH